MVVSVPNGAVGFIIHAQVCILEFSVANIDVKIILFSQLACYNSCYQD